MKRATIWTTLAVGLALAMAWSALGLFFGEARIVVVNDTDERLEDVRVTGRGLFLEVDAIPPGESFCSMAGGFGETSLRLTARQGSVAIEQSDLGYLEGSGGYRVTLRVLGPEDVEFDQEFGLVPGLCWPSVDSRSPIDRRDS